MVETKPTILPEENTSLNLAFSFMPQPLRAIPVELSSTIDRQSKMVDSLLALVANLSQTVQDNVVSTNTWMVNLHNDMNATISANISQLQINMDEGLSYIRNDLARRDDNFSAVKNNVSTLIEAVKKVEDDKKAAKAASASKKQKRAEKKQRIEKETTRGESEKRG